MQPGDALAFFNREYHPRVKLLNQPPPLVKIAVSFRESFGCLSGNL
jgi:hypothetical protein